LPLLAEAASLTPPLTVVVLPLLTGFRVPSPRDECEFEREVLPDLLPPVPRDRRDEFELAEDGREGWEGGARVAPDVVEVGGADDLGIWSGEAMIAGRHDVNASRILYRGRICT
jgi:hypothetical protein